MSRMQAFAVHMALTAAALVIVFVITRFWWYPYPLLRADGAVQAYALLVGGSLTLGPLLTLMVFKPGKKSLRWDLAVIGLLQAGAFAFSTHVLYAHRIQMVVYAQKSFYALDAAHIARIGPKGRALLAAARMRPFYVYVHLPHNKRALWAAEIRTLQGEPPIFLRGWRYRPYTKVEGRRVAASGYPLLAVSKTNPVAAAALKGFRKDHRHLAHYTFVLLHGTYTTVTWVLRRADGQIVDSLPFNAGYGRLPPPHRAPAQQKPVRQP
ncbi:MAG: hypothetical protein M0Z76_07085 [Gammaproteobacteria bacterium]|nr:hypothetical protein [Gammaproteobacteria bacterium]